ncbi:hypothetical protein GCM10010402_42440 [Actinomadura luteofluorescens]
MPLSGGGEARAAGAGRELRSLDSAGARLLGGLGLVVVLAAVLPFRLAWLGPIGLGTAVVGAQLALVLPRVLGLGLAGLLRPRAACAGLWFLLGLRVGFGRRVTGGLGLLRGRAGGGLVGSRLAAASLFGADFRATGNRLTCCFIAVYAGRSAVCSGNGGR